MWIKEQNKNTNKHKGTKQSEEMEKSEYADHQDHSVARRVALQSA